MNPNKELIKKVIEILKNGQSVTLLDPADTTKYRENFICPFEVEEHMDKDEIEEYQGLYYWGAGGATAWTTIEEVEEDLKTYPRLIML